MYTSFTINMLIRSMRKTL